jgi:hypothetical protein
LGILQLRERGARPLIAHALADVDCQVARQARLGLELLEIDAIGFADHLPIDIPQVVPRRVLPMLGELDRLPSIRAAMLAGEKAVDDVPGAQLQPVQPGDRCGIELER